MPRTTHNSANAQADSAQAEARAARMDHAAAQVVAEAARPARPRSSSRNKKAKKRVSFAEEEAEKKEREEASRKQAEKADKEAKKKAAEDAKEVRKVIREKERLARKAEREQREATQAQKEADDAPQKAPKRSSLMKHPPSKQAAEKAAEQASKGKGRERTRTPSEDGVDPEETPDEEDEIDEDEEDALRAHMNQPYLFSLKYVLKARNPNNDSLRVKWTRPYGSEAWVEGGLDTYALEQEIGEAMQQVHFDDIDRYIVILKSQHSRATRQRVDLTDLSLDSWQRVANSMRYQHRQYPGYEFDVVIECIGQAEADLKRPSRSMDSPMSPARRRTRTVQQEEQQAYRRDQNEAAGDYAEELLTKWACKSNKCSNEHGICFVAYNNNHYAISTTQKLAWATAISKGTDGASTGNPPNTLLRYLIQNQKPVGGAQQSSEAKKTRQQVVDERFDRLMDMQVRQQEQAMMQRMTQSTVFDTPQPPPQPPPQLPQPPQWPYPPYPQYQAYPFPTPTPPPPPQSAFHPPPPPPLPPPQPESHTRAVSDTAPPPSRSSPLAEEDEAEDALADFWAWKTSQIKSPEARMRLVEIRAIIDHQMWKTEDYKQMSDRSTAVYSKAMSLGIPDGFASHLRDDIHRYKTAWRTIYKPARQITNLRMAFGNGPQEQGGFER